MISCFSIYKDRTVCPVAGTKVRKKSFLCNATNRNQNGTSLLPGAKKSAPAAGIGGMDSSGSS